jgi:hypothetical protein
MATPPPLKRDKTAAPTPPPVPVSPPAASSAPPLAAFEPEAPEAQRERPRRGMRHDLSHLWTAYWFAVGLGFAGLLGTCPGVYEIIDHLRQIDALSGVPRWAYFLILLGAVQLAYALYVGQLPDWSAIWMATLFTLLLSAAYATVIGFLMLVSEESGTLALVQLAEPMRHKAISWCFVMLSVNCLLTYLGGRSAANWYRSHATLVAALKKGA